MRMRGLNGRATSVPIGIAWAALAELVSTGIMIIILALTVDRQMVPETGVGYGVMLILAASSFLGGKTAIQKIKRQRMLMCMLAGVTYFGMLMLSTALFFGGQYQAVPETLLLVLGGSVLAAITGIREKRGGKRKKIRIATC